MSLLDGSSAMSAKIVREFPQQGRTWAEGVFLSQWAEAYSKGDAATADRNLLYARSIGQSLRERSHETLLAESVEAIDDALASGNRVRIAALVEGHLAYRRGRLLLRDQTIARAVDELEKARSRFELASSPMSALASFYLATASYNQNNIEAATSSFRTILSAEQRHQGHRASLAYVFRSLSVCDATLGHWSDSNRAASLALSILESLGEPGNAAAVHAILAENLALLGDPQQSQRHYVEAMRLSSLAGDTRVLLTTIGSASRVEMRRKQWQAARALAAVGLSTAGHTGPPNLVTQSLAQLAVAEYRLGDIEAANRFIQRASIVAGRIPDDDMRTKLFGDIAALRGAMLRDSDPRRAAGLLTQSIGFHEKIRRTFALPELYLERGRCRLSSDDDSGALDDFFRGIAELEKQRASVNDVSLRSGMFDDSGELFIETIRLLFRRGEFSRAFEYAERSRARALLDQLGESQGSTAPIATEERLRSELGTGTVLLEYVTMPDGLVIFSAGPDGLSARNVRVDARALDSLIDRFIRALEHGQSLVEIRQLSSSLQRLLVEPVRKQLIGATQVVVIPDGRLQRVPFAALVDSETQSYLVERFAVAKAPSVSVFLMANHSYAQRSGGVPERIAIFANPAIDRSSFGALPDLPMAELEAKAIASLYERSLLFERDKATTPRFAMEGRNSDVIHFGGHAIANNADTRRSAILLASDHNDDNGALYTSRITRFSFGRTRLVVLAACSTLVGPTRTAEGMTSIARAFVAGGVPSVIGTLWDVDDAAASRLTYELHKSICAGASPAAALRSAQLQALRSTNAVLRHPGSWAAFELVGAPGQEVRATVATQTSRPLRTAVLPLARAGQ